MQVDLSANIFGQRNEQLAGSSIESQQGSARLAFAGKVDVAHLTEQGRGFPERTGWGSERGSLARQFESRAADQVGHEVATRGENGAILQGNLDVQAAQFFRIVDRGNIPEAQDTLAGTIAVDPQRFEGDFTRGAGIGGQEDFAEGF